MLIKVITKLNERMDIEALSWVELDDLFEMKGNILLHVLIIVFHILST